MRYTLRRSTRCLWQVVRRIEAGNEAGNPHRPENVKEDFEKVVGRA